MLGGGGTKKRHNGLWVGGVQNNASQYICGLQEELKYVVEGHQN